MNDEIKWSVGKEGTGHSRLDLPPYRAFFYWFQNGEMVEAADFDKLELEAEIQRLRANGQDSTPFEQALKVLVNG
jgi:hypothetical protein